jgi:hypothetical protein
MFLESLVLLLERVQLLVRAVALLRERGPALGEERDLLLVVALAAEERFDAVDQRHCGPSGSGCGALGA